MLDFHRCAKQNLSHIRLGKKKSVVTKRPPFWKITVSANHVIHETKIEEVHRIMKKYPKAVVKFIIPQN